MSLADILKERKDKLKPVTTVVTRNDGVKVIEKWSTGEQQELKVGQSYGFCVDNSPDGKLHCVNVNNLYISSQDGAHNYQELKEKQITHILNVATGVTNSFPGDFTYKTIEILDLPEENITVHFPELFSFIQEGMRNGATLVHCNAGISRSATAVIAFLMYSNQMSLQQAYNVVKRARPATRPNDGFWKQLQVYEQELLS